VVSKATSYTLITFSVSVQGSYVTGIRKWLKSAQAVTTAAESYLFLSFTFQHQHMVRCYEYCGQFAISFPENGFSPPDFPNFLSIEYHLQEF
jgi:hypothetical protein